MNTIGQLHIYLCGQFRLLRDGGEISSKDWHTRQARQLFKVLLQERGRLVPARKLIDLLWPENVENAHKALRSAVSALRDVLEPAREPWLSSRFVPRGQGGYALLFPPEYTTWIDVIEFERLLDSGLQAENTPEARKSLERALHLYTGDYLAEDGETAWVLAERARLRDRYFAGVIRLMQWLAEEACYAGAIELGRRALELDRCREPLYRLMMQSQATLGDNASALQTFEQCRQVLARYLGADPSAQTQALHMAILKGTFSSSPSRESILLPADPLSIRPKNMQMCEREQQLCEAQEQALHYTMQAADYARRAYSYQQALADYDAASCLLQVRGARAKTVDERDAQWWGRLYRGRGLVYEALLDWQGMQTNHDELLSWAACKRDPLLIKSSCQRMIVNRSLMGYLPEALSMGREFVRQLQSESLAPADSRARESLSLLTDLARRWQQLISLDRSDGQVYETAARFPRFCAAPLPCVRDWERVSALLGSTQAAFILTSYGWALLLQGMSVEAEGCLRAARQAAEATGQVTCEILASLHLTRACHISGQHERGVQEFTRCIELGQQVPEAPWVTVWPLLNQGYYRLSLDQLDEAEQHFDLVERQLQDQDLPAYRCSLQIGRGLLALARRQFASAHLLLHETLMQGQCVYIEVYILAEIGLARIAQQWGNYAEASQRLYNMLVFSGRRSLLHLYAASAFDLARLHLVSPQDQEVAALLEHVYTLLKTAGATDLARECRALQARVAG